MGPVAESALSDRLAVLERCLVNSSSVDLASELASLQQRVNRFYTEHPELSQIPSLILEFKPLLAKPESSVDGPDSTVKHEEILAKLPAIVESLNLLAEFSAWKIPDIAPSTPEQLHTHTITEKAAELQYLARRHHLLVCKSVVLLERFTALVGARRDHVRDTQRKIRQYATTLASLETQ